MIKQSPKVHFQKSELRIFISEIPLLVMLLFFSVEAVSAQTGNLRGEVSDASTGETLIGANIILVGTAVGTATDSEGEYLLRNLPTGNQVFSVGYLGYKSLEFEVDIVSGETIVQNIELQPDVVEGEEIEIQAQALAQAEAIRRQLSSNTIVNVVSGSRLRELPDVNAAESVGRLPGVSIIRNAGEGQKVAIRGLDPQYNSVTIDGDRVTSTDLEDRSVDMSMISPEMLSGIEVYKVIRPDMDADAIGGSVNFSFSGAPSDNQYRISLASGYHNHITGIGAYKGSASGSVRIFNDRLGIMGTISSQRVDRSSHVFGAGYSVIRDPLEDEEYAPIGIDDLQITDRTETRDRHGLGVNLDWKLSNGRVFMNNFTSRLKREEISIRRRYLVSNQQEHRFWNRELQTDVFTSSLRGEHKIFGETVNVDWRISRNVSINDYPYDNRLYFREESAMDSDKLDRTKGPEHLKNIFYNNHEQAEINSLQHYHNEARERDLTASMDIEVPVRLGRQIFGHVKFGGKYYNKDRFRNRESYRVLAWQLSPSNDTWPIIGSEDGLPWQENRERPLLHQFANFKQYSVLDGQYNMDLIFNHDISNAIWKRYSDVFTHRADAVYSDYKATESISAGYIMTELNIGQRLMILPGVRYESENSNYTAKRGENVIDYYYTDEEFEDWIEAQIEEVNEIRTTGRWFPMVQARYQATRWLNIRGARTESTSRPSFYQLVPRQRVSHNLTTINRGNPHLRLPKSKNYDVILTLHSNLIGLFSVGGFYKEIEELVYNREAVVLDPEEEELPVGTERYSIIEPVNNPNITNVKGIEVEWQSNLTWLPRPFNGLVINANFTRLNSKTQYPQFYLERGPEGLVGVDTFRVAPMVYQPDEIANVSVGYDYRGFSVRLSMLYQGSTLRSIGARQETDSFVDDYRRWDLSLKQNLLDGFASVFANVQNLSNRRDLSMQFTREFPTSMEYYGWTMDVGVRLQL